jgi:hypothetical protein
VVGLWVELLKRCLRRACHVPDEGVLGVLRANDGVQVGGSS